MIQACHYILLVNQQQKIVCVWSVFLTSTTGLKGGLGVGVEGFVLLELHNMSFWQMVFPTWVLDNL